VFISPRYHINGDRKGEGKRKYMHIVMSFNLYTNEKEGERVAYDIAILEFFIAREERGVKNSRRDWTGGREGKGGLPPKMVSFVFTPKTWKEGGVKEESAFVSTAH